MLVAYATNSGSTGELADFDPRGRDGVQAPWGEAFVTGEQAVDGVVLFDVGAGELEEDDGV